MRAAVICFVVLLLISSRVSGKDADAGLADDWGEEAVIEQPVTPDVPKTKPETPKGLTTRELFTEMYVKRWERSTGLKLKTEILLIVGIVAYIVNIFVGRRKNDKIAKAWAKEFCLPDGIFEKNFHMVGIGAEASVPLMKESASDYKLYASGRRHCSSMTGTLKLRSRQDIFSLLLEFIWPVEDKIELDVVMKEQSMPLTVIAVATKKAMRAMLAEETGEDDVRKLTKKLDVKIPGWPSDKLVVHAEHSGIFEDFISEPILDQIFRRPAFETQGKYFRYVHITPDQSYGPKDQSRVIRFQFAVPPVEQMAELTKLISSVGVFIDLVGNFKLSGDLHRRAEKLRQDVERKGDTDKSREIEEAAEERRNAKRLEEAERLKRMTPEQREKYQEKKQRIQQGRQQKKFMKRM